MRICDIMTKDVKTCHVWECLNAAAQVMWEHRFGCVPILDENGTVVGMLTDRDICMAAYTQGKTLREMTIRSAMSKVVHFAGPRDSIKAAEEILKSNKIHRLPIVDEERKLVGFISLDDIAREALRQREAMTRDLGEAEVGRTLAVVSDRTPARMPARPSPLAGVPST